MKRVEAQTKYLGIALLAYFVLQFILYILRHCIRNPSPPICTPIEPFFKLIARRAHARYNRSSGISKWSTGDVVALISFLLSLTAFALGLGDVLCDEFGPFFWWRFGTVGVCLVLFPVILGTISFVKTPHPKTQAVSVATTEV